MTERSFAAWVLPTATTLADDRRAVIDYARNAPETSWDAVVTSGGWTRKDVLAHLAGGNDQALQHILRAAVHRTALDPGTLTADTDAANASGVDARRGRSVAELIDALEQDGEEIQDLLARLDDGHRDLRGRGAPMTLGEFLDIVYRERHDAQHLSELRRTASAN